MKIAVCLKINYILFFRFVQVEKIMNCRENFVAK